MEAEAEADPITRTTRTYDSIAPRYCAKTRQPQFLRWERRYIARTISMLGTDDTTAAATAPLVLDAGCGDGRHCKLFEAAGARALGIDRSVRMIAEARRYYPAGTYAVMDFRNLALGTGTLAALWSSGAIYHVPKAQLPAVLRGFRRVLRRRGILAISFKIGEGEGLEAKPRSHGGGARYFAYYAVEELVAHALEAGFELEDQTHYPEAIYGDQLVQCWFRARNR